MLNSIPPVFWREPFSRLCFVLMLFLAMPSPTWAKNSFSTIFYNARTDVGQWFKELVSPPAKKYMETYSRGPLKVFLLENTPLLQAGKKVVYLGWAGGEEGEEVSSYQIEVTGNGETWSTTTSSAFVEIKAADFKFEADNDYVIRVSCCTVKGKEGQTVPHQFTVVKNVEAAYLLDEQLSSNLSSLEKQLTKATRLAKQGDQYKLEAYQILIGILKEVQGVSELQKLKKGLETGLLPKN